ncbi:hypothetical protein O6H91_13G074800 [Diphasiastrum complanatum]|uniref:Uncharacterized protein n=1 Tax=Diphasiastrum complanatum TaxID=34168 RepID=A0ACC2BW32_DIPCM|nr:hypothetical protein O6H91_Y178700 [Diphasiastrum complanatum]KAJ7533999.1 hypothetical protein O6H91_13G074800 [Diphasiastrum complanatum]
MLPRCLSQVQCPCSDRYSRLDCANATNYTVWCFNLWKLLFFCSPTIQPGSSVFVPSFVPCCLHGSSGQPICVPVYKSVQIVNIIGTRLVLLGRAFLFLLVR